ncbi:MAG: hypothetical protein KBS65_02905 [Prevotella sp.]|nr:hypothetical protein [Candidatus Equicola stercoris]
MITIENLAELVRQVFDTRDLASNTRYKALEKVVQYIKDNHKGDTLCLSMRKSDFVKKFEESTGSRSCAAKSAINELYNQFSKLGNPIVAKGTNAVICDKCNLGKADEKLVYLMESNCFRKVGVLNKMDIPEDKGVYAIRIDDINAMPNDFAKILKDRNHNLLYIGITKSNLRQRLWEEELHLKRPATFFRSIGAILGFMPPKGSLSNTTSRNYRFSRDDERRIIQWMENHLLVNFISLDCDIDKAEDYLIKTYKPLINISKNPCKLAILEELRNKCVEFGRDNFNLNP